MSRSLDELAALIIKTRSDLMRANVNRDERQVRMGELFAEARAQVYQLAMDSGAKTSRKIEQHWTQWIRGITMSPATYANECIRSFEAGSVKARKEREQAEREERHRTWETWRAAEPLRQRESALDREVLRQMAEAGYKVLSRKLHPDVGGSTEAMTRLNRVREQLKKVL